VPERPHPLGTMNPQRSWHGTIGASPRMFALAIGDGIPPPGA
jgi:hypothetical protein